MVSQKSQKSQNFLWSVLSVISVRKKLLEKCSRRNRGNRRNFWRNNWLTDNADLTGILRYFLFSFLRYLRILRDEKLFIEISVLSVLSVRKKGWKIVSQKSGNSQKFLRNNWLADNADLTDIIGFFLFFSALFAISARKYLREENIYLYTLKKVYSNFNTKPLGAVRSILLYSCCL